MMKKIVFFAGGTLGHIYPSISFINSLDKRKYSAIKKHLGVKY